MFDVTSSQLTAWKAQLLEHISVPFGDRADCPPAPSIKKMEEMFGRLTLEKDFLESAHVRA
jgi:hypothetical protein